MDRPPSHITLDGVPAAVFIASQNHQHDLLRELALVDLGTRWRLVDHEVPERVAALLAEILADYAGVRTVTRQQALDALARGEGTVTLQVPVQPGIVEALHRWLALVEAADRFCAEGLLLTLPAPAEVAALRRWYVQAIADRLVPSQADQPHPGGER